jgi:hypothetical protein
MPRCSKQSLSFRFLTKTLYAPLTSPICHLPHPSHPS